MKMTAFRFGALWFDRGIHHPEILGAFDRRGALIVARLADGACEWRRQPGETAEGFERRVTGDLLDLMGLAPRPSIDSEQAPQAAE